MSFFHFNQGFAVKPGRAELPRVGPFAGNTQTFVDTLGTYFADDGGVGYLDGSYTKTAPFKYKTIELVASGLAAYTDGGNGAAFIWVDHLITRSSALLSANGSSGTEAYLDVDGDMTIHAGSGGSGGSGGGSGAAADFLEPPQLGGNGGVGGNGSAGGTSGTVTPGSPGLGNGSTYNSGFTYGNGSASASRSGGNGFGGGGDGGDADGSAGGGGGGGGAGGGLLVAVGNWLEIDDAENTPQFLSLGGSGGFGFSPGTDGEPGGAGVIWMAFKKKTGGTALLPDAALYRIFKINNDNTLGAETTFDATWDNT